MPIFTIDNIPIDFPFQPYPIQIDYMTKVIESLKNGKNSILESPTGTGKTLCLLCSCLAWQDHIKSQVVTEEIVIHPKSKHQNLWNISNESQRKSSNRNGGVPKIIYSSRTHSQLSQCIGALRQTAYSSRQTGIIASREQLCINPAVMKLESNSSKIFSCKKRLKTRSCQFYNKFESNRDSLASEWQTKLIDIEQLVAAGKESGVCPFYLSRDSVESADVLFLPYNYLLNSHIRRLYNIDLTNNVVIFDEAHNIESVCEDSASVELSSAGLASCIEELRVLGQHLHDTDSVLSAGTETGQETDRKTKKEFSLEDVLELKSNLLLLESELDAIQFTEDERKKLGSVRSVEFLFDLLEKCGFTHRNRSIVTALIDQAMEAIIGAGEQRVIVTGVGGLERVAGFLNTVFQDEVAAVDAASASFEQLRAHLANYYRVFVRVGDAEKESVRQGRLGWDSRGTRAAGNRALSFWCLSPGRAMRQLASCGPRAIILTSGTLYSSVNVRDDMDIRFEIELRNKHVIGPDQMMVSVCTRGADGEPLNSSFETRDKISYINSLGNVIVNLAKVIPRGVLVVFPSYGMMRKCIERWESCDIYNSVMQSKQLIVEPQDKVKFQLAMEQFHARNADPLSSKGAILFAVARGKVSEGLDLSDHQGRGVIVVGLPYPAVMEPRVRLKMTFLDERRHQLQTGIDGRSWYKQQAYRAVNQSVGRVIRHSRDFGAIFLCDERFASAEARSQLPLWMQTSVAIHDNFSNMITNTIKFFCSVTLKYPPPSLGLQEVAPTHSPDLIDNRNPNRRSIESIHHSQLNAPYSSQVMSFSPSLRGISDDLSKLFKVYSEMVNEKQPELTKEGNSLMDILNMAEKMPKSTSLRRSLVNNSFDVDLSPEKSTKKAKKYRLVNEKEVALESAEYIETIKKLFAKDKAGFKSYQNALKLFKENNNIDILFSSLNTVLGEKDHPGLVRDFIEFLRPEHKPRFQELCKSVLGLDCTSEKENVEKDPLRDGKLDCVCCHASPASQPLGAPCKHICCFLCWKSIIESEKATNRCPKCNQIIRRRNLVRIKIS